MTLYEGIIDNLFLDITPLCPTRIGFRLGTDILNLYSSLSLICGRNLCISVPGKNSALSLIAIDLTHITDIQVMVSRFNKLLQAALDRHPAV